MRVVDAVLPGVVTGVNETVFAAQFEKPLHGVGVFQVCGPDKFVALNTEFVHRARHSAAIFATNSDSGTPAFLAERSTLTPCSFRAGGHNDVVAAHAFCTGGLVSHTIVEYVWPMCGKPFV